MDKITHKVRCEQWTSIIKECLASGMPKTTWCREHGISDKSFFYWQRILREEAYLTTLESTLTPAVKENPAPTTTDFIEIKMTDQASSSTSLFKPDVIIRRGAVSIEISNTATEELLNKVAITRQNMANWMIRLGESYLAVLYDYLHQKLYDYHVIQADETPVLVNHDGRSAGAKSYMWVYRSGHLYADRQIVLYDYHKTRNSSHPREFLRDYSGICVTDGYQVYHTLEREHEDLQIAGCWVQSFCK